MDHFKILKRSFNITWNYRLLWIFGILLALTSGGNGPRGNGGGDGGSSSGSGNGSFVLPDKFRWPEMPAIPQEIINSALAIGITLACLIVAAAVVFSIIRYVSETALIRMVDRYEAAGEKVGFRQGFRLGWTRSAFRLFLIDLLFGLGGLVVFLLLLLIAAAPLLVWLTANETARILGTVTAIGLGMLLILLTILVAIALSLLIQYIRRVCVLEELGVSAAIRRGVALVRQRLGDNLIMGAILLAMGLAWTILLIPVAIMLVLAGIVIAGLPGLLVGGITAIFANGVVPLITGILVGGPIFVLVVATPLLFLGGLKEVYKSSAWTLTYRELIALQALQPEMPTS